MDSIKCLMPLENKKNEYCYFKLALKNKLNMKVKC
jgi:hypothetical protein